MDIMATYSPRLVTMCDIGVESVACLCIRGDRAHSEARLVCHYILLQGNTLHLNISFGDSHLWFHHLIRGQPIGSILVSAEIWVCTRNKINFVFLFTYISCFHILFCLPMDKVNLHESFLSFFIHFYLFRAPAIQCLYFYWGDIRKYLSLG